MNAVFTQFALFVVSWTLAFGAICFIVYATRFAGKLARVGVMKLIPARRVTLNTYCRKGAKRRMYSF